MAITKIPRKKNVQADALAKAWSATEQETKMKQQVLVQPSPSIDRTQGLMQVDREKEPEPEWDSDVIKYLRSDNRIR